MTDNEYLNYINIIKNSGLFDAKYYLKTYSDSLLAEELPLEHFSKIGLLENRNPNKYFDTRWYKNYYNDIQTSNIYPIIHFVQHGLNENRFQNEEELQLYILIDKSTLFDEDFYQNSNDDLKNQDKKFNFLLHYIRYGEKEGRRPNKMFSPNIYLEENQEVKEKRISPFEHFIVHKKIKNKKTHLSSTNLKIAIIIHVFYLEKIEEILYYISNIPYQYSLYLTVSKENESKLKNILNRKNLKYKITTYPNQGYDILPFLFILSKLQRLNYDLICKIHTKKGAANLEKHVYGIDDVWFNTLMNSILGSSKIVENIIDNFEKNKDLALLGCADFYKSAQQLMYGNEFHTSKILNTIDKTIDSSQDWGFIAGSIFWSRLENFQPLFNNKKLDMLLQESVLMQTGQNASIFHAMERIFGLLPKISNMKTAISYAIDLKRDVHKIIILSDTISANSIGIGMTLQNEYEIVKNYNFLKCFRR